LTPLFDWILYGTQRISRKASLMQDVDGQALMKTSRMQ